MAYIIVADDDELVGELVCAALIEAGHSAGYMTDPRDALRLVKTRRPDLLILDCNMPEMSGLGLLRELRKSDDLFDLPVMMLTGRRGDEDVKLAHFAGADDYMRKPFEPAEVVFRVEQLLAKSKTAAEPALRPRQTGFGRRRP